MGNLNLGACPENAGPGQTDNQHDVSQSVAGAELRQFVERIERLNSEKADIAVHIKEVRAEAKSRGFMVKAIDRLVKLRARDPDDIAEEEAVLETYKSALGM